jgi:hypothetical protein
MKILDVNEINPAKGRFYGDIVLMMKPLPDTALW